MNTKLKFFVAAVLLAAALAAVDSDNNDMVELRAGPPSPRESGVLLLGDEDIFCFFFRLGGV